MKNCFVAVLLSFLLAGVGAVAQVHGSGTTNAIPVWVSPHAIGNSVLFQSGGNVGIGTTSPAQPLDVVGNINASGTGSFGTVTTSGDINLPTTSGPSVGVINFGGIPFLQAFGYNIFLGLNAGNFSSTGFPNIGIGSGSLSNNTTGLANIAIGTGSQSLNTSGDTNVSVGYTSLFNNTTGVAITAIGTDALANNTTGNGNTAVGYVAGYGNRAGNLDANTTGTNNTFLGIGASPGTTTPLNNATAIGAYAAVSASNAMVLGDGTINVGIGTQTPTTTLQVAGGDISTTSAGTGLIVNSPDGTKCSRIGIDNTGAIAVTPVSCP
jgi:hypothetical protein